MDWCGASVTLAWSPKNGEVFQNGRITPPLVTRPWTGAERP